VFVDGDFWHGRNWPARKAKLAVGHNSDYWIRKIERNVERDKERNRELRSAGWRVLRVWESQINTDVSLVVHRIKLALSRL
jgi:DNA mismatch endonuclease Vsr